MSEHDEHDLPVAIYGTGWTGIRTDELTTLRARVAELLVECKAADAQLERAADCIEHGRYDEALLHCYSMSRPRRAAIAKAEGTDGQAQN